jgi:hypothetical protein
MWRVEAGNALLIGQRDCQCLCTHRRAPSSSREVSLWHTRSVQDSELQLLAAEMATNLREFIIRIVKSVLTAVVRARAPHAPQRTCDTVGSADSTLTGTQYFHKKAGV